MFTRIGAIALAAASIGISNVQSVAPGRSAAEVLPGTQRRGKGQNNRRGKGLKSKAKKRPNRLTISKRVRRKHRRAAK